MGKSTLNIILFSLIGIFVFSGIASAYWIWTPETKKFINPKYAVKDSPKEQYEWAMSFYDAKDFQRAAMEFEKLAKQYEFSEYASKAQYYVGLSYENMQKYYFAFQNYQKALDNFPHIANMDEILAREYAIGNIYLEKPSPKVLGTDIMAPLDRAVEIFKKVVENAPYGKYAQDAQFKLGEALKKSERYEEAVQAYHKLVDDYPNSKLATKAMYEEAYCAYKASLKPAYDVVATDNAIKTFEKFVDKNKDSNLAKEADTTMKRLKNNVAEKSLKAAEFYESQGRLEAAIIYYQDVMDTYPDSSFVNQAKARIEALKVIGNKKVSASLYFDKEKPQAPIAREVQKKNSWSPFSFDSKKPDSKKEPVVKKTPKNKVWKPLNFIARKEETKKAPEAPVVEAPAAEVKKDQFPAPAPESPQGVETPRKEDMVPQAQEAPKKKTWKPFSFDSKKEPVVKETPKNKVWKPLNFDTKEKEEAREWKPLNFDKK